MPDKKTEPRSIAINLQALIESAHRPIVNTFYLMAFGLGAAKNSEPFPLSIPGTSLQLRGLVEPEFEKVRGWFTDWLPMASLQRYFELYAMFLENACLLAGFIHRMRHTGAEFDAGALRAKIHRFELGNKLDYIDRQMENPVASELKAHVRTLGKVRNCLEHRQGVVGLQDVTRGRVLAFGWRATDLYMVTGGQRQLITESPFWVPEKAELSMPIADRHREFELGQRIELTAVDVAEIGFTFLLHSGAVYEQLRTTLFELPGVRKVPTRTAP